MIHVIAKELSHSVPHSRGDASLGLQERACMHMRGEFLFAYTLRLFCTQSGSFPPFFFVKKKKSFFVFHLVFYLYFIGSDVWNTFFFVLAVSQLVIVFYNGFQGEQR